MIWEVAALLALAITLVGICWCAWMMIADD